MSILWINHRMRFLRMDHCESINFNSFGKWHSKLEQIPPGYICLFLQISCTSSWAIHLCMVSNSGNHPFLHISHQSWCSHQDTGHSFQCKFRQCHYGNISPYSIQNLSLAPWNTNNSYCLLHWRKDQGFDQVSQSSPSYVLRSHHPHCQYKLLHEKMVFYN